jgi:hypothetical protein
VVLLCVGLGWSVVMVILFSLLRCDRGRWGVSITFSRSW